ncbi:F0F1 ATP synthase subunit B [Leptolyngbya sp. FACHB-261]|uniref:F0F1 ATP synthase subunit B n=1 Tax=Leptolyngbya sp. FACHB-261 TaxID=2692806 RepID=UPI001682E8C6|nr:F0F1 ATP synthase subunit B [Leptolyngbya sp. FACHB-261]MBD2100610.1 F0F1 ATP synthase subunit B [Leptolyngbya sp. FACHB-261]
MESFLLLATEAAVEGAEEGGFALNTDILSTNLINLLIIFGLLIYAGRGFLGNILGTRRETIKTAIEEAERRKREAAEQLADQQANLAQAQDEAKRIRAAAEESAQRAKETILAQAQEEIVRLREGAQQEVGNEQERVIAEVRQRVATLALERVQAQLSGGLSEDVQQQLINNSLQMLGGRS